MDKQQSCRKQDAHSDQRTDGVLPLAIRRRLWDQLWTRLLAPPVDPTDRQPSPRHGEKEDGPQ